MYDSAYPKELISARLVLLVTRASIQHENNSKNLELPICVTQRFLVFVKELC